MMANRVITGTIIRAEVHISSAEFEGFELFTLIIASAALIREGKL
jgi:hypothetical protein